MSQFPFYSKQTSRSASSGASTPSLSGSQTSLADPSPQSATSDVSWQGGNPLISVPLSALLIGRSASCAIPTHSPPPVAGPSRPTKIPKHSALQISSTQSLKLDPRVCSVSDDGYFGSGSKQLSPIVEQDYFSPERRTTPLPLEHAAERHVPTQNGSEQSDTPRQSPVYSTFINRPLKRSISQMSQATLRTQLSSASAPPTIPPLDLLPSFSGSLDTPPLLTPSHLSAAPLPPIPAAVAGPSHNYPGTYDSDASSLHADSFISAQSGPQSGRNGYGQRVNPDPYSQAEQGNIIRSNTTSSSSSSSYVDRRWTASLSFGSDLLLFSKAREKSLQSQNQPTPACFLFWLGFIAPWCWMIGGWMLTENGKTKAEGNGHHIQPFVLSLWSSVKEIEEKKGKEKAGGASVPTKRGYGFARGYPFIVPSVESLTPSAKMLRMKTTTGLKVLDPWVARCRVGAVISGILLLTAFVVALVVVGGYR